MKMLPCRSHSQQEGLFHGRHDTLRRMRTILVAILGIAAFDAQAPVAPTNDAPNPYRTVEHWAQLPTGRTFGSLSAVAIDRDGKSVWVAERCGGNSACLENPTVDPILHFDASGRLIKSFGAGMIVSPHGIDVDRAGNVWVTDYQDNAPRPPKPGVTATKGHQLFKFSRDGKLLLTLGEPGG